MGAACARLSNCPTSRAPCRGLARSERDLILLRVAELVEVRLARELDHRRRPAHEHERGGAGRRQVRLDHLLGDEALRVLPVGRRPVERVPGRAGVKRAARDGKRARARVSRVAAARPGSRCSIGTSGSCSSARPAQRATAGQRGAREEQPRASSDGGWRRRLPEADKAVGVLGLQRLEHVAHEDVGLGLVRVEQRDLGLVGRVAKNRRNHLHPGEMGGGGGEVRR